MDLAIGRVDVPWERLDIGREQFFDAAKVSEARNRIAQSRGKVLVYGHGAYYVAQQAKVIAYIDMARWEIQMRSRRGEVCGLGIDNRNEEASRHYKRGYFVDWIVCDKLKKTLLPIADFWLDTHTPNQPKMITGDQMRQGLVKTAHKPFRVVPFFDPAPWGGQWMKQVCDLDFAGKEFSPLGLYYDAATKTYTTKSFKGHYDGGGYSVRNINYALDGDGCVGFIAKMEDEATLSNVNFSNVHITASGICCAGIATGSFTTSSTAAHTPLSCINVLACSIIASDNAVAGGIAGLVATNAKSLDAPNLTIYGKTRRAGCHTWV